MEKLIVSLPTKYFHHRKFTLTIHLLLYAVQGSWSMFCGNNYFFSPIVVWKLFLALHVVDYFPFQRARGKKTTLIAVVLECVPCGSRTTKRWSVYPRRCPTGRRTGTTGRAGRSRVAGASGRGARPRARTHSSRVSAGPPDSRTTSTTPKTVCTCAFFQTPPPSPSRTETAETNSQWPAKYKLNLSVRGWLNLSGWSTAPIISSCRDTIWHLTFQFIC